MAGSPKYKVYSADNEYVASVKYLEDAAALCAMRGNGTTVRLGHGPTIWREGSEEIAAGESYDRAAEIMLFHERDEQAKALAKVRMHQTPQHILTWKGWHAVTVLADSREEAIRKALEQKPHHIPAGTELYYGAVGGNPVGVAS